jgi:hypothetical protein
MPRAKANRSAARTPSHRESFSQSRRAKEIVVRPLCGIVLSGLLTIGAAQASPAAAHGSEPAPQFVSGLICDTREQAERFVLVLRDNVETAIGTVNNEAGTPDACMVATYGFVPGQIVSEVERNGAIVDVVEVRVLAVATTTGVQMIEPKVYYSIIRTGDRNA